MCYSPLQDKGIFEYLRLFEIIKNVVNTANDRECFSFLCHFSLCRRLIPDDPFQWDVTLFWRGPSGTPVPTAMCNESRVDTATYKGISYRGSFRRGSSATGGEGVPLTISIYLPYKPKFELEKKYEH